MLDPLFRSAAVDALFSDRSSLQGMLDFEAALARAEAQNGVIPPAAECKAELFVNAN
jgi:3-carboxy-cis,cis-muconate cycloisomerase